MKVFIIEDETAAVRNLISLLHAVEPDIEIAGTADSITGSVDWLSSGAMPDVIFMDIHLADGDAFMIFDRVKVTSPVIFTTAYDQYAIEAFHVNSIDYLLKPIQPAELKGAIDKLKRLTRIELDSYLSRTNGSIKQGKLIRNFLIPVKDRIVPLPLNEIAFCHTSEEKVSAYTFDGRKYLLDKSLDTLASVMPEDEFFRANRQFIIARRAITDMAVWYGNRLSVNLVMNVPERIIVSKNRVPVFKNWLSGA